MVISFALGDYAVFDLISTHYVGNTLSTLWVVNNIKLLLISIQSASEASDK